MLNHALWTLLVLPLATAAPAARGLDASSAAAALRAASLPAASPPAMSVSEPAVSADWVVESGDNVCGVSDARQISNPAKVSYQSLLDDTPELEEMHKKGIDKDSPEGQILHNKGVDRVRKAAKAVMTDKSYCSVWKKIRHKEGVSVPDVTELVRKRL